MRIASILWVLLATTGLVMADEKNDELGKLVAPDAKVEKLAGGMKFTEGPVWVADAGAAGGGSLLFSDQPNDATMLWNESTGLKVHRQPTDHPNGHTLDLDGYVIGCREYAQKVIRFDRKLETFQTVVDSFNGKHFNSPNDVVVKRDGTIWFTDPPYNMPKGSTPQYGGNYVFRFDPKTREVKPVATDFNRPNGLCFSPDEKTLYIADSGKRRHIRRFTVSDDGSLTGGEVLCTIDKGVPDGIRCDERGNVWSSAGDGVQIFAPDGKLIGKILCPEAPANLCFGGPDGKTVYITARTSLYRIPVLVHDAAARPATK
jgi:gluconolactonase